MTYSNQGKAMTIGILALTAWAIVICIAGVVQLMFNAIVGMGWI